MKKFSNSIGFSVYPSSFEEQKDFLLKNRRDDTYIFTSFHINEEMNEEYKHKINSMCAFLKKNNFKMVADVEPHTLKFLSCNNFEELIEKYQISWLRIDYGMELDEMLNLSKRIPVAINASTVKLDEFKNANLDGCKILGMHNFYPRPQTGLSTHRFNKINKLFRKKGVNIFAFIAGDLDKRGPIFEGLPTIESLRSTLPLLSFIKVSNMCDRVFVGDLNLTQSQLEDIVNFCNNDIISVKASLLDERLYDKVFQIRIDSPKTGFRLDDTGKLFHNGGTVKKFNTIYRPKGAITMDNLDFKRYAGEVQIVRHNLEKDSRINVIGYIDSDYLPLLDINVKGKKIILKRS